MTILAIDQGTSSTKALLLDGDTILAVHEVPVRPRYLDGGGVEQDPVALLDSVLDAGRAALVDAGSGVEAVALANQGESVLAWDRATGRPLTPVLVWQDGRAEEVTTALADHADDVAARSGLALDPYFSAPKMAWLRRHLTTDGVVTTTDSWLLHHLTGEFVTDASTASRSLVTDLDEVAWDPGLLRLFGLADEALPRIVDCDEVVGTTTAFGMPLPVAGVIVDQQAALLAQRCLAPGDAKCTLGTGAFLLATTGSVAVRSAHRLAASVAWRVRGETTYCLDGQVYTVASAVRWLADLGVIESAADIDGLAAPDSGGAVFVPALAGLAAPWWRSDVRGALHGLGLATGRGEVVRAVVDGIAGSVAVLCQTVAADVGAPVTILKLDGGLTRSTALVQAIADLAQTPVLVSDSPHATAKGAAVAARLALHPGLSVADAIPAASGEQLVEPSMTADHAASRLATWMLAVDACIRQAAHR
jgi:glycerol kinase